MRVLRAFVSDRFGTTAIEYALIAGGIFMAIVITADQVGMQLGTIFADIAAGFQN